VSKPLAIGVVVAIAGISVALFFAMYSVRTQVNGTISGQGGKLGTWTMRPDECESGERDQFRGVSLYETENAVRVTYIDPIGGTPSLAINTERASCKLLEGKIERKNGMSNHIWNISGYVRFDCTWNGGHVTGDVVFDNCH